MEERPGVGPEAASSNQERGSISALLAELAQAPEESLGGSWAKWLHPGAVVGRFELVRELGRGGFGVVWEARDRELGRSVAFKAVRATDRAALGETLLLDEAEAVARLSHPNIITLHDVCRSEHGPYLVLELLRGRTLGQRLEQGPLPAREALRLAIDIARGLAHAHAAGVVHRDLKPANVFLCDDGQVKVLDFGLAHAFGRRRASGGTPGYMAPEQWREAPEDERTDVFALGVMLHRSLSGKLPFPGESGTATTGPDPAPRLEVPGAPELGALVGRMLAKDPGLRPRDGREVLPELERIAASLARTPESSPAPALAAMRQVRGTILERARSSETRGGPRGVRLALLMVGIGALAAAPGTLWYFRGRKIAAPATSPAPATERTTPSIAVLPFVNLSSDKEQDYFSDGIAEEILNALAQLPGLHVAGRTSSFSFKGKNQDLASIAARLHVATLLEGSVQRAGNRVRITAQLINAADGYHLWSKQFDRELVDILQVQDELAMSVVEALKLKLLPGQSPSAQDYRTPSTEAYLRYLEGRKLMAVRTAETNRLAFSAFRKAVELDPGFAPAWAGLGFTRSYLGDLQPTIVEKVEQKTQALGDVDKSIALAPALAEAYVIRGVLRLRDRFDWTGAQSDFERALAFNPGLPFALEHYGYWFQAWRGQLREAAGSLLKAIERDPLNPSLRHKLGCVYVFSSDLGAARKAFDQEYEISSGHATDDLWPTYLLILGGKPDEALEVASRLPLEVYRLVGAALAQHVLGHEKRSLEALATLHEPRFVANFSVQVAQVHAFRGERDLAFEWLDRAYANRDPGMMRLKVDPLLRKLGGDPRYAALLEKMKLPPD